MRFFLKPPIYPPGKTNPGPAASTADLEGDVGIVPQQPRGVAKGIAILTHRRQDHLGWEMLGGVSVDGSPTGGFVLEFQGIIRNPWCWKKSTRRQGVWSMSDIGYIYTYYWE